ncbi:MAG: tetratricopeptide repeat protein [Spirochaetaceae bacterium]|jgi:tetratricopeptide (TPR) repeat protein|nr:tetratricopeptide repeat protein [Spirochaetaceae bacterium]
MMKHKAVFRFLLALLCALLLSLCSSAPKRAVEIRTMRFMAETQLDLSNKYAGRGNYKQALDMLEESRRIAVAVDDPELLVRTALAYGDILYYLDKTDEALAYWKDALQTAQEAHDRELSAVCSIYLDRYQLLSNPGNPAVADKVKHNTKENMAFLTEDTLNAANGWIVAALAEKELKNYGDAEAALKNAFSIHSKGNYLELAAYDCYLLASLYSKQGSYEAAIASLHDAIGFDRRAENSHGLGMDYLALGDIYKKTGNKNSSIEMYTRAAGIFKAARLEKELQQAQEKL